MFSGSDDNKSRLDQEKRMTFAALTGFRFFDPGHRGSRRWELRFSWAEITGRLGFALALCLFEEHYSLHIHLGWPNLFIRLPFLQRWHHEPHESMECWGITIHHDCAHLNWGRHCKIIHWPWDWEWVRTSYLMEDGATWAHDLRGYRSRPVGTCKTERGDKFGSMRKIPRWRAEYPFRYVLRSGEVQERIATVEVHEMEWRWRWFMALPFPRKVRRSIDINFDGEVGERSGSWKGGCLGCGFELWHDETPKECLRRMESERKF
jgi:hypothetical protein